jgi:hypothetical protein
VSFFKKFFSPAVRKSTAPSAGSQQPWMIGSARVIFAASPAAIKKFRDDGISPLSAVTMILAIERRNANEFEEAEPGTVRLSTSAKVDLAAFRVYQDKEQQVIITDRKIEELSMYQFIGLLNVKEYAFAKCRALGIDIDRLWV